MFRVSEIDLALETLIGKKNSKLSVISSHKKAFNLLTEQKELLSLVSGTILCGPGRAIVSNGDYLPNLTQGALFYFKDRILYDESGLFLFDFSKVSLWQESLSPSIKERNVFMNTLMKSFGIMMHFCKEREVPFFLGCKNFMLGSEYLSGIEDPVYSRLYETIILFLAQPNKEKVNKESVKKLVNNLLGLGYGLTPSGDDIISGLLNSFYVVSNYFIDKTIFASDLAEVLSFCVLSSLHRTTAVSSAFLSLSAKGRIPQEVLDFCYSCNSCDYGALQKSVSYFAQHGYSSGREIFLGLFLGFCILFNGREQSA